MKDGEIVESGTSRTRSSTTRAAVHIQLLNAVPHLGAVVATEGVEIASTSPKNWTRRHPDDTAVPSRPSRRCRRGPGASSCHRRPPMPTCRPAETAVARDRGRRTPSSTADVDATKRSGAPEVCRLVVDLRGVSGRVPASGAHPGIPGGVRLRPADRARRGRRSGRGVRLRQDHHRPGHRRAAAVRRGWHGRRGRHQHGQAGQGRACARSAQRRQLRVPGSGLVAEPPAAGR